MLRLLRETTPGAIVEWSFAIAISLFVLSVGIACLRLALEEPPLDRKELAP